MEVIMPALFGFMLGVVVTILGAYLYDAASGNAANGLSASTQAPMVNWNVVNNDWQNFETNVRTTADNLERTIKNHTS
jgi:hypothetical protein